MDYSKLSDFDINELVAKATVVSHETYPDFSPEPYVWNEDAKAEFNPCNNPADAWPIIVERKINIEWHEWKNSEWKPYALSNASAKSCYDNKPLRAAMIVFLMMQDSANVPANSTGSDIR